MDAVKQTKPFLRLPNSKVEYSTDIDFFIKNQILSVIDRTGYPTLHLVSRLEKKKFIEKKKVFVSQDFSDNEIIDECKKVHQSLMTGKFGKPTFID